MGRARLPGLPGGGKGRHGPGRRESIRHSHAASRPGRLPGISQGTAAPQGSRQAPRSCSTPGLGSALATRAGLLLSQLLPKQLLTGVMGRLDFSV